MNSLMKWIKIGFRILAVLPISLIFFASDIFSPVSLELLAFPTVNHKYEAFAAPKELSRSEVIQNNAFANLIVEGDLATISAGFVHPYSDDKEVMIEWFLYAWDNDSVERIPIRQYVRQSATGYVEVNTQISPLPLYDYYLLESKNKIQNNDGSWYQLFASESRFSRIAPRNGIWERTGEVTSTSAVLHTYLSEKPPYNATDPENLRVPPMAGFARFMVYGDPDLQELVTESGFYPVDDYIQVGGEWRRINYNFRWTAAGLEPDTTYYYVLETMASDGLSTQMASNINTFKTSPTIDAVKPISFVVAHCLDVSNTVYSDPLEAAERGLKVFDSMLTFDDNPPDFIIMQGDTVYYDGGNLYAPDVGPYPSASFIRRWLYWYATYQFQNMMVFFQQVPGYWMVDDHDYWENNVNVRNPDGWYIFRNVNPTPGSYGTTGEDAVNYYDDNPYSTSRGNGEKYWRAVRWGQHLEIFFEEGRHHRDEGAGLIWGDEQREWLEDQIRESDATFKIISATTPLLGPLVPDDLYPSVLPDKHANLRFRAETELFLNNIKGVKNVFIVAGDRHYKYHSIINSQNYPELSMFQEFSAGSAAGPPHAIPGNVPDSEFATMVFVGRMDELGASAGYLRVEVLTGVGAPEIIFKLIRVTEDLDNDVVYQYSFPVIDPADQEPSLLFLPFVIFRH
jgi:phosphodiesterase/alkaline phosphatase D-like protein